MMSDDDRKDGPADSGTTMATEEHESFLNRWSRRKTMVREGREPEEPEAAADTAEPATVQDTPDSSADEPPSPPEAQTATGEEEKPPLPSIESLDEHSDYSAFLAPDVAEDLRQKALRKLFHSPKFNLRDGLDDYDLDYTNPEPLGNVITAEMRHRVLREAERLAERAAEAGNRNEAGLVADPEADDSRDETDLVADAEAERPPQIEPEQSDKPDEHDDPDERSDPA